MTRLTRRNFLLDSAAGISTLCAVSNLRSSQQASAAENKQPPFEFSLCNETFGDWPFEKAFAKTAECGYTGVEIAPFTIATDVTTISTKTRGRIRRQLEKAGLKMPALHWLLSRTKGFYLTSPDRDVRRKTAAYLCRLACLCRDLGGHKLIFGSPKERDLLPGVSNKQAYQYAADVFSQTLSTLEKTDTTIAIEPLSPNISTFINTAAEAVELIELVDSPRCRLILDCYAMAAEETPIPELIKKNRSLMVHFHANDPNMLGPGFGKLDFVPIIKALCDIQYNGWVSVEVFDYSPGPERLARQSIDYMKRCLAGS